MQLIARATQVGEPLDQMLFCLQTMSVDRGLQEKKSPDYVGQRSPYFWICGRDTRPLNLCYAMAYHVLCLQLTRIIVRGNPARLAVSLSLSVSPPLANPAYLSHRRCSLPPPVTSSAPLSPAYVCSIWSLPLCPTHPHPYPRPRLLVAFSASVCLSQSASPCLSIYCLSLALAHSLVVALLHALPSHLRACRNPEHKLDKEIGGGKSLAETSFSDPTRSSWPRGSVRDRCERHQLDPHLVR